MSLQVDGDAMLNEVLQLNAALQQRVIFLAGRVGALEKENTAMKQIAEMKSAPRTGSD